MAHPFPAKVEVIPKRRRKSPIGSIKSYSNEPIHGIQKPFERLDVRELGLQARESRLNSGYDLFRFLLSRNLKKSNLNVYAADNSDDDSSDVDIPEESDELSDRSYFLGFKQFQLLELIRQLKKISRPISPQAFKEYDVSDDEDDNQELSIRSPVPKRAPKVRTKNENRSQVKPIKQEPQIRISSIPSITGATKNLRRKLDRVQHESESATVYVSNTEASDNKDAEIKPTQSAQPKSNSRTPKEKVQVHAIGLEKKSKLTSTKTELEKKEKITKKSGNKLVKKVGKLDTSNVDSKDIGKVVSKNVIKKRKSTESDGIEKKVEKEVIKPVVKTEEKPKKKTVKKEVTKKMDKVVEKKVDKKVVVAKGLAAIKNIWKERLSQLSKTDSNISDPVPQHFSPALSSFLLPVSEHSSINSPRTPSILREARLQVDTSKLSPLVMNQNAPSTSSSNSSSSSSDSSDSDEPEVKVVQKKTKSKSPIIRSKSSPSKKRPGEIVCVICNVTKFYSHKQRRFGQYSCETCSKFFYNFLKSPSGLFCSNHGDCVIGANTTVHNRCRACWLKICLQTYTITDEARNNLAKNNFLPKLSSAPHVSLISIDTANVNHHEDDVSSRAIEATSTATNNRSKTSVDKKDEHPDGLLMMVPTVPIAKTVAQMSSPSISSPGSQNSSQQPSPAPKSLKDIRVKKGKVVFAPKESPVMTEKKDTTIQTVCELTTPKELSLKEIESKPILPLKKKRQIVTTLAGTRGPRTKNVCRTSLTGLPVATFGSIGEKEKIDDFGNSEGNIDSDDSDNIPLHDYIWKVIAEDQASKAPQNGLQKEPEPKKVAKKMKSQNGTVSKKKKADFDKNQDLTNGCKSMKVQKTKNEKTMKSKSEKVQKPKSDKVLKPKIRDKEKAQKVSTQPKKVASRKNSNVSQTIDDQVSSIPVKHLTPCIANMNSDTDIDDIEEEEELPIKVSKKVQKRKISSDDEVSDSFPIVEKKKVQKAKAVKLNSEDVVVEKKSELLTINTTDQYCSCPVPVLQTPPDQKEVHNGVVVAPPPPPPDIESPIKKEKKKSSQEKKNRSSEASDPISSASESSMSPKKKVERSLSGDRAKARKRCNECSGCKAVDCGNCAPCKDKKKFGGPNVRKQACKMRRCISLFNCGAVLVPSPLKQSEGNGNHQNMVELSCVEPMTIES